MLNVVTNCLENLGLVGVKGQGFTPVFDGQFWIAMLVQQEA